MAHVHTKIYGTDVIIGTSSPIRYEFNNKYLQKIDERRPEVLGLLARMDWSN